MGATAITLYAVGCQRDLWTQMKLSQSACLAERSSMHPYSQPSPGSFTTSTVARPIMTGGAAAEADTNVLQRCDPAVVERPMKPGTGGRCRDAARVAAAAYVVTGMLGVSLSYHRCAIADVSIHVIPLTRSPPFGRDTFRDQRGSSNVAYSCSGGADCAVPCIRSGNVLGCIRRRKVAPNRFSQESSTAQCAARFGLRDLTFGILESVNCTPERSCQSSVGILRRHRSVDSLDRADFQDRSSNVDQHTWSSYCELFVRTTT